MNDCIFLFGEAEKGKMCTPFKVKSLNELYTLLGDPSPESLGIDYAVQTLLTGREIIYYRVHEEGLSTEDYKHGAELLYKWSKKMRINAIGLPGMGNPEIIDEICSICEKSRMLLLMSQKDLFDYLAASKY